MADKLTTPVASTIVPAGKKLVARQRRKQKVKISAGTWIFIILLVAAFAVWNFYLLPRMGRTETSSTPPQVFQIAQHRNPDIVKAQLKTRQSYLTVTPKPIPSDTGKTNPFE